MERIISKANRAFLTFDEIVTLVGRKRRKNKSEAISVAVEILDELQKHNLIKRYHRRENGFEIVLHEDD